MNKPILVNGNKSVTIQRWLIIATLGLGLAGIVWAGFSKLGQTIMEPQVVKLSKRIATVEAHQTITDTIISTIKEDVGEIKENVRWIRDNLK